MEIGRPPSFASARFSQTTALKWSACCDWTTNCFTLQYVNTVSIATGFPTHFVPFCTATIQPKIRKIIKKKTDKKLPTFYLRIRFFSSPTKFVNNPVNPVKQQAKASRFSSLKAGKSQTKFLFSRGKYKVYVTLNGYKLTFKAN